MFRIRSITLYKGTDTKEYLFTDNAYVYGHNNVGKTALTKVIDNALGSSERLSHAGLDNIDAVGAYFKLFTPFFITNRRKYPFCLIPSA